MLELIKNSFFLLFTNVIARFFSAFVIIYIANILSVDEYGLLSISLALGAIFSVLSELGLNNTVIREATKENSNMPLLLASYLRYRIIWASVIFVVSSAWILVFYNKYEHFLSLYFIVEMTILSSIFSGLALVFYQSTNQIKRYALLSSSIGVITSLSLLAVTIFEMNFFYIALCYGITNIIVSSYVGIKIMKNEIHLKNEKIFKSKDSVLLAGMKDFSIARVISVMRPQMGNIILERVASMSQVGYFSLANRIPSVLYSIPSTMATSFYATLFKLGNNSDVREHNRINIVQLQLMSMIGAALYLPFVFHSDFIISLLFKDKWGEIGSLLSIISLIVFLQSINQPLADSLTTIGKQKERTRAMLLSSIVGGLLFLVLGFKFGASGGAYAAVIMEMIYLVLLLRFTANRASVLSKGLLKNISGFIITIFIYKTLNLPENLYSLIGLGFIYIVVIIVLNLNLIKMMKRGADH